MSTILVSLSTARTLLTTIAYDGFRYYKISFTDSRVSDPEQIITSDVPQLCTELSEVAYLALRSITDGSYFTWRLAKVTSMY